ncbi:MAG: pyridoxamine 5'-phosphate oxidase family protein [Firmicutes bacterium]|nr:pyridoxamine 5'-phosphate oxidase family protein [Bacillota bacterium]
MFREIRRFKQALTKEECIKVLTEEKRGILSVLGDDDYPYGMPINHWYNPEDGKIYFHSGPGGHKLESIAKHNKVSFCVYDKGYYDEGEISWALNIKSIIVFGKMEIVEDKELALHAVRQLSYKFTQDDAYIDDDIERNGKAVVMLALTPEHMTGKLVNES